jgi:hypothetical protein
MLIAVIGLVILALSVAGAVLWVRRDGSGRERQMQVLLFALYFWVLMFIQIFVAGVGYWALTR